MPECRIVIAISNSSLSKKLKVLLQNNGYIVIDESIDVNDCMRKVRSIMPDILIVGPTLSGIVTNSLIAIVLEEKISSVILLAHEGTASGFVDFRSRLDFEIINAPINTAILLNTIYMLSKISSKVRILEEKVNKLEESLETRKLMDRAKGILIKSFRVDEKEAHRRIQKTSMDTGKSLKEVAKMVIEKYG